MKRIAILLAIVLGLGSTCWGDYLGKFKIDEYVTIPAGSHQFSTGNAYQPTTLTYSIYEEGGTTGIAEGVNMTPASPFDAIVGAYQSRVQLTAAAGYEAAKNYTVWVQATTDSVSAVAHHTFQIEPDYVSAEPPVYSGIDAGILGAMALGLTVGGAVVARKLKRGV